MPIYPDTRLLLAGAAVAMKLMFKFMLASEYVVLNDLFFRVLPDFYQTLRETPDDREVIDRKLREYLDLRSQLRPDEHFQLKLSAK